jgi:hypothetical protein
MSISNPFSNAFDKCTTDKPDVNLSWQNVSITGGGGAPAEPPYVCNGRHFVATFFGGVPLFDTPHLINFKYDRDLLKNLCRIRLRTRLRRDK